MFLHFVSLLPARERNAKPWGRDEHPLFQQQTVPGAVRELCRDPLCAALPQHCASPGEHRVSTQTFWSEMSYKNPQERQNLQQSGHATPCWRKENIYSTASSTSIPVSAMSVVKAAGLSTICSTSDWKIHYSCDENGFFFFTYCEI